MVAVMSVSDEPQSMPETLLVSIEKQEMLWRVVKQGAEKLTEFKRNQLCVLPTAYADVFSCSDNELHGAYWKTETLHRHSILGLALNIYRKFQNPPNPHVFQKFLGEAHVALDVVIVGCFHA